MRHQYTGFDLKIKMEDSGCFTNVHSREWLVPVGARKGDSSSWLSTISVSFFVMLTVPLPHRPRAGRDRPGVLHFNRVDGAAA